MAATLLPAAGVVAADAAVDAPAVSSGSPRAGLLLSTAPASHVSSQARALAMRHLSLPLPLPLPPSLSQTETQTQTHTWLTPGVGRGGHRVRRFRPAAPRFASVVGAAPGSLSSAAVRHSTAAHAANVLHRRRQPVVAVAVAVVGSQHRRRRRRRWRALGWADDRCVNVGLQRGYRAADGSEHGSLIPISLPHAQPSRTALSLFSLSLSLRQLALIGSTPPSTAGRQQKAAAAAGQGKRRTERTRAHSLATRVAKL
jgi:hypothetical protein